MNSEVIRIRIDSVIEIASARSSRIGGSGRVRTTRMMRTPMASAMSPRFSMMPMALSDGSWKPPVGAASAGAGPAAVTSLIGIICRVYGYRRVNGAAGGVAGGRARAGGVVSQTALRAFVRDVRFTFQTTGGQKPKLRRPCFRKARGAPVFSPKTEGAKRRQALVRIAAPGGLPHGKARPFSGREQPIHNADRRAYRRLAAAFSLDLETAFWKRTGAADRRNALDSAGFPPRSSAPTSPLPDGPM